MERTVLLSGCSSGIGRASAEAFLDRGWTVYATARNPADVADLGERGAETARLDVTEPEHVSAVVDRVVDERGHVDCLVNNAGIAQTGALEEVPTDNLRAQFDVNFFGPHRLVRAVLPHMRERGSGTIVNVSSVLGHVGLPAAGSYSSAKHAVKAYTEVLRTEVAPFGIDVVHLEPGFAQTRLDEKTERTLADVVGENSPYERLHENAVAIKDVMMSDLVADEAADVAEAVADAAEADEPGLRRPVGLNGRLILASRFLPDRLRLWAAEKLFWARV